MSTAAPKRLVQFGPLHQCPGSWHWVQRSTCGRYGMNPGKAGKSAWSVCENPDRRGTWDFKVLFVERTEQVLLDKLDVYEQRRRDEWHKAQGIAA